MKPFGWFIEAGNLRWFTQEESRVTPWRDRKDAKVIALQVVEEEEVFIPYCQVDEPKQCEHEPDVLKRCIKCGEDLNVSSVTRKSGS